MQGPLGILESRNSIKSHRETNLQPDLLGEEGLNGGCLSLRTEIEAGWTEEQDFIGSLEHAKWAQQKYCMAMNTEKLHDQ